MPRRYTLSRLFQTSTAFDPDHDPLETRLLEPGTRAIELLGKYFRPTYHGMDHIPRQGPALLVGNHGIIGFDGFFILSAIYRATGRLPRGLGDHHLFVEPLSRRFWTSVGALDGNPENAIACLKAGHLVNVYPGGARDAMKGPEGLYRLHWAQSKGFIRVAMRAGVPIILHMGIGTDDTYKVLGRLRFTGKVLGHAKYEIPIWMGWGLLPRPVKFDYYLSEPIALEGGPSDADNQELVDRNHKRVWEEGQQMLADGLRRRRSIWFG